MNNPQQLREYDAVLGGNSPSLDGAAVLGGIEGVKLRLQNPDAKVRIAALEQALNCGEQGLDLVIEGLKDKSWNVEYTAYSLLKPLTENKVKQALIEFNAPLKQWSADYTYLRDLLAQGKWQQADARTARIILAVAKKEEIGFLTNKDIDSFPSEDLRTIDQLWLKYSNGRFGFSVQKRIYQSLGGTREYNESIWNAFGDHVGWRKEGVWLTWDWGVIFDIKAPEAHLPVDLYQWGLKTFGIFSGSLLSRQDL